jgi:hypothetical protein
MSRIVSSDRVLFVFSMLLFAAPLVAAIIESSFQVTKPGEQI